VLAGLHIGEGIETCMTARLLGLRPTWALGSAGEIGKFPVLNGIERLTILAEHDEANRIGRQLCGERWDQAGREVLINYSVVGKDLNDAIRSGS
jgi:putative DNA primase/helicase